MTEDVQAAPEPVQSEGVAADPVEQTPEPKAKAEPKAEAKPQNERDKRRASIEKAIKAVSDDEDDAPANGSPSTPKADPKAEEKDEKPAKAEEKDAKAEEKGPSRAADGKFAAKDAEKVTDKPGAAEEVQDNLATPHAKPPSRFSADAKAEWEKLPEAVRAETYRMQRELEDGLKQKDRVLRPLEPFVKMAEQHGTTVDQALSRYVSMEQMLRQNPAEGLRSLAQNMGMTPQQMANLLNGQQPGQADPRDRQIMALQSQIQQMQQQFGSVSQTLQHQQQSQVVAQVEQFATGKPRFDELAPEIVRLIETGYAQDLEDAYVKAERLNPAPPQQVQPEPAPAPPAQTRPARSLTGAPSAGSNPGTRKPSANRTEAIQRAMRQAGLA
jgi:hypothetical protein